MKSYYSYWTLYFFANYIRIAIFTLTFLKAMPRRILVTGANKGIGLALVRRLLKDYEDVSVLLTSRDRLRGEQAIETLLQENPQWLNRLKLVQLDVSSKLSAREAAQSVAEEYSSESSTPLYGICNNAGISSQGTSMAEVLETNVYGAKYVVEAFLPLLQKPGGRIVNIASASGPTFVAKCSPEKIALFKNPDISWNEIETIMNENIALEPRGDSAFATAGYGACNAYGLSKACLNSYTMLIAKENPDLFINSCTPGFIATDLVINWLGEESGAKKDHNEGTHSATYCLMDTLEGNGYYYGSDKVRSPLDRYRGPGEPPYLGD